MSRTPKYKEEIRKHPLLRVWAGILARCYTPCASNYKAYGGSGVRVCDDWRCNFISFYNWALSNKWEKGMEIDKDIIPQKLGIPPLLYSPETCMVVTRKENCNNRKSNRKIEYMGVVKNICEWATELGINRVTLSERLKRMSVEDAFNTPIDKDSIKKPIYCVNNGEKYESINDASRKTKISTSMISTVLSGRHKQAKGLLFKYLN